MRNRFTDSIWRVEMTSLTFVEEFKNNKPQDAFINLKRTEDISTIYHQEYRGGVDVDMDYWCKPPVGFKHKCDLILGVFGERHALAIAVDLNNDNPVYKVLAKNNETFSKDLLAMGIAPMQPYTDVEIVEIVELI